MFIYFFMYATYLQRTVSIWQAFLSACNASFPFTIWLSATPWFSLIRNHYISQWINSTHDKIKNAFSKSLSKRGYLWQKCPLPTQLAQDVVTTLKFSWNKLIRRTRDVTVIQMSILNVELWLMRLTKYYQRCFIVGKVALIQFLLSFFLTSIQCFVCYFKRWWNI